MKTQAPTCWCASELPTRLHGRLALADILLTVRQGSNSAGTHYWHWEVLDEPAGHYSHVLGFARDDDRLSGVRFSVSSALPCRRSNARPQRLLYGWHLSHRRSTGLCFASVCSRREFLAGDNGNPKIDHRFGTFRTHDAKASMRDSLIPERRRNSQTNVIFKRRMAP